MHEVTGGERRHVAITIYNEGTSLVQDRRLFALEKGANHLSFTDVAEQIDATSVQFISRTDPAGTGVLEQNYAYDLVNLFALLRRYIDQNVEIITEDGTLYSGILLSGRDEIILRADNGQIVVIARDKVRDLRFPDLPGGLITRPTLRWLLETGSEGEQELELTYLTSGMNWTADYVLLLAQDSASLDLNGWITLNNTSGASFENATVKLVAGDVNRLPDYNQMARGELMMEDAAVPMATSAPQVSQREFFEYQLYEIERPVTVADNETKQVEFVSGGDVPASTFYVYDSSPLYYGYLIADQFYGQSGITNVQSWLEFTTDEEEGLGADLPAGRVRVYQEDIDGTALLIGENTIEHTPQGEEIQLFLGNAFDLVGERTQTSFRQIAQNVIEETYEIRLRNQKDDEAVEIRVPEHLFRWTNWEILNASHEYTQLDANTIEFRVEVPPQGETVITYTVRYSWQ